MIKHVLAVITALIVTMAAAAQDSNPDHKRWLKEMRQQKHEYIVKQLDLTQEQSSKFMPMYEAMENELNTLMKQTRKMERDVVKKGDEATDLEYEKAAEAIYEMKGKEGAIEMKYMKQFKTVLTPKQLFKLKNAENKFMRELMKHRKGSGGKHKK